MSVPFVIPENLRRSLSWQDREAAAQGQVLDFVFDGSVRRGPGHRRSSRRTLRELRARVDQVEGGAESPHALVPLVEIVGEGLDRAVRDYRQALEETREDPDRVGSVATRLVLFETARRGLSCLATALEEVLREPMELVGSLRSGLDRLEDAICDLERLEE